MLKKTVLGLILLAGVSGLLYLVSNTEQKRTVSQRLKKAA